MMKTRLQKQSKERKIIYFIIGLFIFNAFGMIPVGIIGAFTAEPMKIISSKTLDDGTINENIREVYYHENLNEGLRIMSMNSLDILYL